MVAPTADKHIGQHLLVQTATGGEFVRAQKYLQGDASDVIGNGTYSTRFEFNSLRELSRAVLIVAAAATIWARAGAREQPQYI